MRYVSQPVFVQSSRRMSFTFQPTKTSRSPSNEDPNNIYRSKTRRQEKQQEQLTSIQRRVLHLARKSRTNKPDENLIMHEPSASSVDWEKSIMSLLSSSEAQQVKKLRKQVLLSLQLSDDDKASKKAFKKAVQGLEADEKIRLDADGSITLLVKNAKKKKKEKKEKKEKKRKLDDEDNDYTDLKSEKKKSKKGKTKEGNPVKDDHSKSEKDLGGGEDNDNDDNDDGFNTATEKATTNSIDKNKPCKGNPQGCTRLFVGNLPFAVDEASLASFLPGQVTHIKWITDKETGKFYGSAFIEMDSSQAAADAVAMAGEKLIGRPIKINFAPARDGDVWPPKDKVVSGGGQNKNNSGQAGGSGVKAMSAKPDGCIKLFCGNLSYEIDDEAITKFFASVDAELKAVRWIHHKDSGDFKGVGFAEFWNTEACEKAASLNGKNLLGRPIRLDWSD